MLSASVEHYLKTIYALSDKGRAVSLPALAQALSISPVSTSEMVRKLSEQGMVRYEPYKGVVLTPMGRARALVVTRRHRLWECFLTDCLGLAWDQVHPEACRLEHATSSQVEEHLAQFLGHPVTCPHGHPIPDAEGRVVYPATYPLSTLEPGQVGIVHSVGEEPELLRYLHDLGLVPQTEIEIETTAPVEGVLTVRVGDAQHTLGWKVASLIQVQLR